MHEKFYWMLIRETFPRNSTFDIPGRSTFYIRSDSRIRRRMKHVSDEKKKRERKEKNRKKERKNLQSVIVTGSSKPKGEPLSSSGKLERQNRINGNFITSPWAFSAIPTSPEDKCEAGIFNTGGGFRFFRGSKLKVAIPQVPRTQQELGEFTASHG